MKILHLANDEKFIHFVADVFNSCGDATNHFFVWVANHSTPLKYVEGLSNMRLIDNRYIKSGEIGIDVAQYDALVVHYLDWPKIRTILQAPKDMPILWSGWGGDYYDFIPSLGEKLLGGDTAELQKLLTRKSSVLQRVKRVSKNVARQVLHGNKLGKALRRINYFSAPIPDDFELIRKHLGVVAEYIQINYASVECTFALGTNDVTGDNILVGNSASDTNNHLEIFKLLSKQQLKDRKVVVPLSYGDTAYRDAVIQYGSHLLGKNFQPIVNFVPIDRYNTMIADCAVVVMGHRRQQAVGNIATMLYKGAKVFLDETTTTYQFLKKRSVFIYGLRELDSGEQSVFAPLSEGQIRHNREMLNTFWGHDVALNNAKQLIQTLMSHKP